ncbi:class I SAM-dependent methyltransferase, partial [Imhoffiella purpurea]|uniref:class I SAM-dependent methyltransferase n=1 Tax=Imhoffiella purpurea TaxID=1249627 RepID=UPI0012FD4348
LTTFATTKPSLVVTEAQSIPSKRHHFEAAPEMIRIAGQKAKDHNVGHIELKVEDACNLSFPDKSFDTVLAANVLHLLFDPDKAMLEMKRVLKDGGAIIVPTYCHGQNPISHLASRMMSLLTHRGFKARSRWSVEGFSDFVLGHGFHVKKKVIIRGVIPVSYRFSAEFPREQSGPMVSSS